MIYNQYNRTYLGGCNRNKNFPNNQYEGYNRSYSIKEFSYCNKDNRTWKYGRWIDMELI